MKGQINVMGVVIIAALLFLFIVGIFVVAIIGPYLQSTGLLIGEQINTIPADSSEYNVTGKLQDMSNPITYSFRFIEWFSYGFIIFFIGAVIAAAAFSRAYPIVALPYAVIVGALAVASMFISSAYTQAASADKVISSWTMTHFLLSNLPLVVIAIGFFGGIAMFVLITTRPEGAV